MTTPIVMVNDTYGVSTGVVSSADVTSPRSHLRLVYNAEIPLRLEVLASRTSSAIASHQTPIVVMLGDMIRPMQAVVAREAGLVTIVNLETGIFGVGDTAANAAQDFLAALHEHHDVLLRQGALSEELRHQLTTLQMYLPISGDGRNGAQER